jgi:hypothetical protein
MLRELEISGRGVFDKETRRKALAFAADAGYGKSMPLLNGHNVRLSAEQGRGVEMDCPELSLQQA